MSPSDPVKIIDDAYNRIQTIGPKDPAARTVRQALAMLDRGELRAAEPVGTTWVANVFIKKAVLLAFRIFSNALVKGSYDKIPLKFSDWTKSDFKKNRLRVLPGAVVRFGACIQEGAVLMPCFVNVGAHIGRNTMIDTWASVGSCAQVGANVHISGGAGIGGVLEPPQSVPVIVEDDVFIGARSEVAEGVIVGKGAVLSMGVYLSQSTPIYDRKERTVTYGKIPPYAVVIPGSLPAKNGSHSTYAAIIVKRVDAKTRQKTSINELLRS